MSERTKVYPTSSLTSPAGKAIDEVHEELGLDRPVGRLLGVDWVSSRPEWPEGILFVYDGGVLDQVGIKAIRLPPDELASYAFVEAERGGELTSALLARRIAACLEALGRGYDRVASALTTYVHRVW